MPINSDDARDFATVVRLDRRAVEATAALVARLAPADLTRPTPCDGWTVHDLVCHMSGQQNGFAAAARGRGADPAVWFPSERPYAEACADVVAAFAEPGLEARAFALPEIRSGGRFPAPLAVRFHLVDNVVHAWDVAVSIGASLDLDEALGDAAGEALLSAALGIAEQVPDGPQRLLPGAAFAPAGAIDGSSGVLDRILVLLGRSPQWAPTVSH